LHGVLKKERVNAGAELLPNLDAVMQIEPPATDKSISDRLALATLLDSQIELSQQGVDGLEVFAFA
jgi:hypothetical protein